MARKGLVAEIFSKALHVDNVELYAVGYVDLGEIKQVTLTEFLKLSENFEVIPASRIAYIKREDKILYSKKDKKESDQI
ncbi:MAG: DUF504 domain-containing protein [Thaumarchaeota archaeon]|nr:DUF504 domain-containing protein [Nitrososphaerota archaeon]